MNIGWTLTADEIRHRPLEQLALDVLRDVEVAERRQSVRPHAYNWLLGARERFRDDLAVRVRLSEAWSMVERRGFLVRHPDYPDGWMTVSDAGRTALASGPDAVRAAERLDLELHASLHPARTVYLGGRHELAAFDAMRAVEVRVRHLSRRSDSAIGVPLIRSAFAPDEAKGLGPLADPEIDGGERVATMELFAGAIGVFKNPPSHRIVDFGDPTRAAEVILFADLLMRMLDDVEARIS